MISSTIIPFSNDCDIIPIPTPIKTKTQDKNVHLFKKKIRMNNEIRHIFNKMMYEVFYPNFFEKIKTYQPFFLFHSKLELGDIIYAIDGSIHIYMIQQIYKICTHITDYYLKIPLDVSKHYSNVFAKYRKLIANCKESKFTIRIDLDYSNELLCKIMKQKNRKINPNFTYFYYYDLHRKEREYILIYRNDLCIDQFFLYDVEIDIFLDKSIKEPKEFSEKEELMKLYEII
jgi:hypothetical protein